MAKIQDFYTEVAIYEVRLDDAEAWHKARKIMIETLASYPGFQWNETLQSLENPSLLMDYVKWQDASLVQKAAEQAMQDSRMTEAFSFIHKTEFFHHFREYK